MRAAFQLKTKSQKIKTNPSYKGRCYLTAIIEEAFWLYINFALSLRVVEMMLERHKISTADYSVKIQEQFTSWNEVTRLTTAASIHNRQPKFLSELL
ncbi:MAG: hypothetical protein BGO39_01530 [Chloroflexi bacterium 54-19]|nr:MAG: hypothetical protein BGO39_01530 [Chloroflexi bacterium 54-19]